MSAPTIVPDPEWPSMPLGSVQRTADAWIIVFGSDPDLDGWREFPRDRFASERDAVEWLRVAAYTFDYME